MYLDIHLILYVLFHALFFTSILIKDLTLNWIQNSRDKVQIAYKKYVSLSKKSLQGTYSKSKGNEK